MIPDYQNHPEPSRSSVYYVKPVRDQESHHYQGIQLPQSQPYYNVYNHYDSIGDVSMATEVTETEDSHYEEIDHRYLGLYGNYDRGDSTT